MAIYLGDQLLTPAGAGSSGQQTLAQQLGLKVVPLHFYCNDVGSTTLDTNVVYNLGSTKFQMVMHPYLLGFRNKGENIQFKTMTHNQQNPGRTRTLINAPLQGKIKSIHLPFISNYVTNAYCNSKIRILKVTKQGGISYVQDIDITPLIEAQFGQSNNTKQGVMHIILNNDLILNADEYLGFELHIEPKNNSYTPYFMIFWNVPSINNSNQWTTLPYIVMEA